MTASTDLSLSASPAPSLVQLGRRVFIATSLVVAAFLAVWLWLSWQSAQNARLERLQALGTVIADGSSHHLDIVLNGLWRFSSEVELNQASHSPEVATLMLRQFLTDYRDVTSVALLDSKGKPIAALGNQELLAQAARMSFDSMNNVFEIGQPVGSQASGYFIPCRLYWRNDVRGTQFDVLVLLSSKSISAAWTGLAHDLHLDVALLHEGGMPLAWASDHDDARIWNLDAAGRKQLQGLMQHAEPQLSVWPDGKLRFTAHTAIAKYPVHMLVSMGRHSLLKEWWHSVRLPFYLIVFGTFAGLIIYLLLALRFRRSMNGIRQILQQEAGRVTAPSSGVGEIDDLVAELNESREKLQLIAQNREKLLLTAAHAGTYSINLANGLIQSASPGFLAMLGQDERLIGQAWQALSHAPVTERPQQRVVTLLHADGSPRWISLAEYDASEQGQPMRYGMAIDVSEREKLLETVHNQSERLQALWHLATDRNLSEHERTELMLRLGQTSLKMDAAMIVEVDGQNGRIRYALDGRGYAQAGGSIELSNGFGLSLESDKAFRLPDSTLASLGFIEQGNVAIYDIAGAPIWVGGDYFGVLLFWCYQPNLEYPVVDSDLAYVDLLASWFGFAQLEQHQRSVLEELALTDGLTGLPNRRAAEKRFASEMARIRRTSESFAVAICDLDRFKLVNDHYGHHVGDEVLKQVARVMERSLRVGDWMARWGGEEFIVFLHGADAASASQAMERLRQAVHDTAIQTAEGELDVTTSVGIGVLRGPEDDVARVLSEADGCLYEAKQGGRDCVVVHQEDGRKSTLWHAGMLKRALTEHRVVPAFQVMVNLQTREIVADEALARLRMTDGSILAAGEFIEAAEGAHLIHAIDETIVQQAMMRCAARIGGGTFTSDMAHFVNVSPQFLQRPELVGKVLETASMYCASCNLDGVPVKPLVLEITERQLVHDFATLKRDMQPLIDYGFRFALDDFGSGYSSFIYLAELPIAFLKIEGWMVQNMWDNPRIAGMLESIVLFARHQGITTIAEFIEDERTARRLAEMGVDWGQGYYFGRPELE